MDGRFFSKRIKKGISVPIADMFQEPRTRALFTNVFPGDEKW